MHGRGRLGGHRGACALLRREVGTLGGRAARARSVPLQTLIRAAQGELVGRNRAAVCVCSGCAIGAFRRCGDAQLEATCDVQRATSSGALPSARCSRCAVVSCASFAAYGRHRIEDAPRGRGLRHGARMWRQAQPGICVTTRRHVGRRKSKRCLPPEAVPMCARPPSCAARSAAALRVESSCGPTEASLSAADRAYNRRPLVALLGVTSSGKLGLTWALVFCFGIRLLPSPKVLPPGRVCVLPNSTTSARTSGPQ